MNTALFPKTNDEKFYNWLFAGLVVVFIGLKFSDLFLPYFWDELGVYSQCAVYQFQNGISLMPSSLPPELSRGHPLFFTFCNAINMQLFGSKVVAAHAFNLFVAVLLLCVVYTYIGKHFNRLVAFVSVLLLAAQPLFIAQSALVVPEVMLSLLLVLSLFNYYEERYLLSGIFGVLGLLTKESAIVLPVVLITYSVFQFLFFKNRQAAFRPFNLFFTVIPYIVFGIFLLIQKQQNGWYFFPYHISGMSFDIKETLECFNDFFGFVTWSQGRYWWMKFMLIAPVIALLTNRFTIRSLNNSLVLLMLLFCIAFLLFSALNFYMERYVVVVVVLVASLTAISIVEIFKKKYFVAIVAVFLVVVAMGHYEEGKFNNDFDMGYRHNVIALKKAVDYCNERLGNDELMYGNFPTYFAITFLEGGYYKPNQKQIMGAMNFKDNTRYFICSEPGSFCEVDQARFGDTLVATFTSGYARAYVHRLSTKQVILN